MMKIQVDMPDELKGTGFPSFQEYCRNPGRWKKPSGEMFGKIDEGGHSLRHLLVPGWSYEILGRRCKTLEEVEKIAINEGYNIDHLDAKPQLEKVPGGSGSQQKYRVHIVFEPKLLYLPE